MPIFLVFLSDMVRTRIPPSSINRSRPQASILSDQGNSGVYFIEILMLFDNVRNPQSTFLNCGYKINKNTTKALELKL
jgi:hypothetical protein